MTSRNTLFTATILVTALAAPLAAQTDRSGRKVLAPGAWVGGGFGFTTIESPASFANGVGLNLVGGYTPPGGLGWVGGILVTFHPSNTTVLNSVGTLSYVNVRVGPRYTLNPRARTTAFVGARVLGTIRRYTFNDNRRRRAGAGGGAVLGVTGATSAVRVEFEVSYDLIAFGDETEDGRTTAEAFGARQFGFALSFLFPISSK